MSRQINLFSDDFLPQKKPFSSVAMLQALAAIAVVMAALYVLALRQADQYASLANDAARHVAERRNQLLALSKLQAGDGPGKQLQEEVVRVEGQIRRRQELLGELKTGAGASAAGHAQYLSALARSTVQGVWLTGVTIGGKANEVTLKGRVLSRDLVPEYMRSLSKDPSFAGRTLSGLQLSSREAAASGAPGSAKGGPAAGEIDFTLTIPLGEPAPPSPKGAS